MGSSAGLNLLRGLFVLLMAAVGWTFVVADPTKLGDLESSRWMAMAFATTLGVAMVVVDILAGRRKLIVFGGVAFGTLIGLIIAYALSFAVALLINNIVLPEGLGGDTNRALISFLNLLIGGAAVYFSVSFVLQTKDDFRFIIPYVEFRRGAKGSRPALLDTSILVDGRIVGFAEAGFFDCQIIVPQFVVAELQDLADHPDRLKRARGRRGLDVLATLKRVPNLDVRIYDSAPRRYDAAAPVDQRLLDLAVELDGRAVTVDFNLNKVAQLSGVAVLNLNELVAALKPDLTPGETMRVEIVRPGSGQDQGVGYLEDGTMVVVEHARRHLHDEVDVVVTNTTKTAAGRMIFGRTTDADDAVETGHHGRPAPRRRPPADKVEPQPPDRAESA